MPVNRRIMARGRELGGYLALHFASEAEQAAAKRDHTPQAVMTEIAVLDF